MLANNSFIADTRPKHCFTVKSLIEVSIHRSVTDSGDKQSERTIVTWLGLSPGKRAYRKLTHHRKYKPLDTLQLAPLLSPLVLCSTRPRLLGNCFGFHGNEEQELLMTTTRRDFLATALTAAGAA